MHVPLVFFSSIIVTLALESMDTEATALNTEATTSMTTLKHDIRHMKNVCTFEFEP